MRAPVENRRRAREWYAANTERAKVTRHAYYLRNKPRVRQKAKEWGEAHPEKKRASRTGYPTPVKAYAPGAWSWIEPIKEPS